MDSLEQWILDIGRHIGALEAENDALQNGIPDAPVDTNCVNWETIAERRLGQIVTLARNHNSLEDRIKQLQGKIDGLESAVENLEEIITSLEGNLDQMTTNRDSYKALYEEQLRRPEPHDPLVQAAEDALHNRVLSEAECRFVENWSYD